MYCSLAQYHRQQLLCFTHTKTLTSYCKSLFKYDPSSSHIHSCFKSILLPYLTTSLLPSQPRHQISLTPNTMPHFKPLSRTLTNFAPILQDIYTTLGENHAFYHECVLAITNAAARHEDESVWSEQMQMVVEGVEAVVFSHAGVLYLLGER